MSKVLGVGGFNLVSPESTDDNTGDADVERDLSPEVSGLSSVLPNGGPPGDELVLAGGSRGSEGPSSGADSTGSKSEHGLLFVV